MQAEPLGIVIIWTHFILSYCLLIYFSPRLIVFHTVTIVLSGKKLRFATYELVYLSAELTRL